jgi:hypothetical protein
VITSYSFVYPIVLLVSTMSQRQLKADLRYKRSAPGARLTSSSDTVTAAATATATAGITLCLKASIAAVF